MQETFYDARDVAVDALRDRGGNVSAHLERVLGNSRLSPADRGLAGELALGTLRRRLTLTTILRAFLEQPDRPLPGPVPEILQVAMYQLLLMDRVPDFAAVNEAVEQTTRLGHRRQGALVNGVLRTVLRNVSERQEGPAPLEPDVLPLGPNSFRRFARRVFTSAKVDAAKFASEAFSLPLALTASWMAQFGSIEQVAAIAMHANTRAPLIMRVNRLKSDVASVIAALSAAGVAASPHENGVSIVLAESTDVTRLEAFKQGLVQPQDPAATAVAIAANPRPGQKVLDFCAAPGTKTTLLAELMANAGSITAMDVSPEKLERIKSNCDRMGITIVNTGLAEKVGQLEPMSYDVVLADVPCSNTGVLARRAEARWRFEAEALSQIVKDQQFLAAAAAMFVKPGGRLVYSTCSIQEQENSQVVKRLIAKAGNLTLVEEAMTLPAGAQNPTKWHDGGYYAVLRAR
jgi:16S rRNA (cytosine967-C5)-methyltransferase